MQNRKENTVVIDTNKIQEHIKLQGLKVGYVARVLDISPNSLRLKLRGETDFKVSEADKLSHLLELTREQRDACFFAPEIYWTTRLSRQCPSRTTERSRL